MGVLPKPTPIAVSSLSCDPRCGKCGVLRFGGIQRLACRAISASAELVVKTRCMLLCSCERGEVSRLRLAALRRRAVRSKLTGNNHRIINTDGSKDEWKLDCGSLAASAFDIYCSCTKRRMDDPVADSSYSPVAVADLAFTRWRYSMLMFHRQFFRDLENSASIANYHRRRHIQQQLMQQQQQTRLFDCRQPMEVVGRCAGVSTRSARHFLCHWCAYSTDRKNNLKRHVITMHRCADDAVMTSASRNHDDCGKVCGNAARYPSHQVIHQQTHL